MQSDIQENNLAPTALSTLQGNKEESINEKCLKYAAMGGLSGLLMESFLHPLDTVRTRIKCNAAETVSVMSQTRMMYRTEGLRSYFGGLTCTLTGATVTNITYFYTYEKLKYTFFTNGWMSKETAPFFAGFIGAFLANMVNLPFDVIRTRMQLKPGQYDYKHFFDGANKVLKYEGFRKLYLGGPAFFTLNALEMGLTFGFYELFYKMLNPFFPRSTELNIPLSIACSVSAAGAAGFIVNPLDVLVTRMQSVNTKTEKQLNTYQTAKKILKYEGVKGFFKGVTGTMSYYAMGALILFPTYETLKYLSGVDLSDE